MCRRGLPGGDDLVTPIDSLSEREKLWRRLFDYISSPAEVRKGQSMRAMGMVQCTRVRGAKMGDLSEKAEGDKMVETVSG
jgi:hypothetical protein